MVNQILSIGIWKVATTIAINTNPWTNRIHVVFLALEPKMGFHSCFTSTRMIWIICVKVLCGVVQIGMNANAKYNACMNDLSKLLYICQMKPNEWLWLWSQINVLNVHFQHKVRWRASKLFFIRPQRFHYRPKISFVCRSSKYDCVSHHFDCIGHKMTIQLYFSIFMNSKYLYRWSRTF